jgi:Uma2 family endonuclease
MATGILVSEEEYLHTAYEPDCEFEDGVLIERNVGTNQHSKLQAALVAYFFKRRKVWDLHVRPEVRIRTRAGKYMLPDICLIAGPEPTSPVLQSPPLLWIEILSPEDQLLRVNRRIQAILDGGTRYVWVIDPQTLESDLYTPGKCTPLEDGVLAIPGTEIVVPLQSIFED